MVMSHQTSDRQQVVRTTQIITGALVAGVLFLAAIAVFVLGGLNQPPNGRIVSGIATAFAVVAFALHLIVPGIVAKQQRQRTSEENVYGLYQTKTIISLSILDGAACLNIVAFIVEHNWWTLAVAGGLVFWMLAMFPTRTRVEHWIETQQMLSQSEA